MSAYKYYINKIYQPSYDLVVLELGDKRGYPVFNYLPGQYAMIAYRNQAGQMEDKHAFSLASSPADKNFIRFGIKIQGPFTKGLLNLQIGDEIDVFGPYGKFVYSDKKYYDTVLIAGGIGVTPFFSILQQAALSGVPNKLSLLYSSKLEKGTAFYDEIQTLTRTNPNISSLFAFTEEFGIPRANNVLHQRLDAVAIKNFVGNVFGKTFFVCGPKNFMDGMVNNLLSLGVSKNQIQMEEFSMTPDKSFTLRLRNFSYALSAPILIFAIAFGLINEKIVKADTINDKKYDSALVEQVNQLAYSRWLNIYQSKNQAVDNLSKQIAVLTQQNGTVTDSQKITSDSVAMVSLANQAQPTNSSVGSVSPVNVTPITNNQPVVVAVAAPVVVKPVPTPTPTPKPTPTPTPTPKPTPVVVKPTPPPVPVTRVS